MRSTLLAVIVLCLGTMLHAQGPSPRLVVLNKEDATLVTQDPATGKVLGSVPTGEGPHEAAVSDDGRWAFASNYGASTPGGTISMVDLATMKEVRRIDVSPLRRPHGLFFHGGKLYFTSETSRVVARYDPGADTVDWLLGTGQSGTHMVWVAADGARVITANIGSNSLTIFERGANPLAWSATVVGVGRGPEGFDVSPDGRELWAAHSQDGGVSVVDLASKKVTATFDAQTKRSNRLKFTRDGRTVLITDLDAGDLVVIDTQSRQITKRIPLGRSPEGILIAPGGTTAYIAVTGDNKIAVLDLKTLSVTRHLEPGRGPDGMAYVE